MKVLLIFLSAASAAELAFAEQEDVDRRLGAILGAAVGDAAAMPLHWIYDTTVIDGKLGAKSAGKGTARADAAFFSPPSCPFYKYPEGENTPYGQQNRVILSTMAEKGFDPVAIQDSYWAYYGPEGAPCHKAQSIVSKTGCYWDGSTKGFVANYQAGKRYPNVGANDTQANALLHMIPLVAKLSGGSESTMLKQVESLIRVTQNTDQAVAFGMAGARILSRVIQGSTIADAVEAVAKVLQDPARAAPKAEDSFLAKGLENVLGKLDFPNFEVVKEVGQSCDYPFNLFGGSHLSAQLSETAAANGMRAFKLGLRQTIEAGGDSGSRSNFVGALLGASAGESGIPAAWKQKYTHYDSVLADAKKWVSQKTIFM